MATPGAHALSSLTRRHGIKVASAANVESCCLAVGEVVGYEHILSASRMNSAIVIFLSSIEKANEIVQKGIVIDGMFTAVLPLSLPSKRVTLSNVPPFISDAVLTQALSRYGKLVSSIKKIPIGRVSPLLKHIVSFRRSVFMIINNDADLDLALNFRVDDFDYVVFVTTDKIKCFGCGKVGHLVRACPSKLEAENRPADADGAADANGADGVAVQLAAVHNDEAGEASVREDHTAVQENTHEEVQSAESAEDVALVEEEIEITNKDENEDDKGETSGENVVDVNTDVNREMAFGPNESGLEQNSFKVPLKRKTSDKGDGYRQPKKFEFEDTADQIYSESDSELSDTSVALSQSEVSRRDYDMDDIKMFLKITKNKRGVVVGDYFPDIEQFVEKSKAFMAEGSFSNKEVYRLKKIVRKLTLDLNESIERS